MPETIGYHVVKTTFGTWLPGDVRGYWSRQAQHQGPVWAKNNWVRHIFAFEYWEHALVYIDDHNVRASRGSRPYSFLCEVEL